MKGLFGEDFNSGETCTNEQLARDRRAEEDIWDRVAEELQGEKRPGLWMKSLAESKGNQSVAEALYMTAIYNSINDEDKIKEENKCRKDRMDAEMIANAHKQAEAKVAAKVKAKQKEAQEVNLKNYRKRRAEFIDKIEFPNIFEIIKDVGYGYREKFIGIGYKIIDSYTRQTIVVVDSKEEAVNWLKDKYVVEKLKGTGFEAIK